MTDKIEDKEQEDKKILEAQRKIRERFSYSREFGNFLSDRCRKLLRELARHGHSEEVYLYSPHLKDSSGTEYEAERVFFSSELEPVFNTRVRVERNSGDGDKDTIEESVSMPEFFSTMASNPLDLLASLQEKVYGLILNEESYAVLMWLYHRSVQESELMRAALQTTPEGKTARSHLMEILNNEMIIDLENNKIKTRVNFRPYFNKQDSVWKIGYFHSFEGFGVRAPSEKLIRAFLNPSLDYRGEFPSSFMAWQYKLDEPPEKKRYDCGSYFIKQIISDFSRMPSHIEDGLFELIER